MDLDPEHYVKAPAPNTWKNLLTGEYIAGQDGKTLDEVLDYFATNPPDES